jgi:uncharacterized protein YndB with AHSA1/START domain
MAGTTPAEPPAGELPVGAVVVARRYPVRREQAFRAWTDRELFSRWFGAPGGATTVAEMDVRPGGSYRVALRHPMLIGWTTFAVGEYLEVSPPERLVFTFGWERPAPPALGMDESRVIVEFHDLGEWTEIQLSHLLLDRRRYRAFHAFGWRYSLRRLAQVLVGRTPGSS